jgi:hypothetical protein
MKKLIVLFSIMIFALSLNAQTLIDKDQVVNKYGATADTLNKDDSVTDTYYIKPFAENMNLFWDVDSVDGTSPKVILGFFGSYDNSEWIEIDETTITVTSGDTTFVQTSTTYLYPYIKVEIKAVDSVQTARYKYNLVIDKK